jgi:HK97 family phage portal protein
MRFLRNAAAIAAAPGEFKAAGGYSAVTPYPISRIASWTDWDFSAAVREGYKGNPVVFACIRRRMQTLGAIPWGVSRWEGPRRGDTGGEWVPQEGHPLAELLENPNPHMSRARLIGIMSSHLNLSGNTILQLLGTGEGPTRRPPVAMIPLSPAAIRVVPDPLTFLSHYEVITNSQRIETSEIIHCLYEDPENPHWGMAPLQAAAREVDTDTEAAKWNKLSMDNRAVPDALITYDQSLTPTQHQQAVEMMRVNSQTARNAHQPMVIGNKANVTLMGRTPVEMDFINGRRLGREMICAAFFTPPVLAGFFDNATLANAAESVKLYYKGIIMDDLELLRGEFQRVLVPLYASKGERLSVDYDVSNVEALQEGFADKVESAVKLHGMGVPVAVINQRLELDLPEYERWDTSYLPGNTITAEDLSGTAEDAAGVL